MPTFKVLNAANESAVIKVPQLFFISFDSINTSIKLRTVANMNRVQQLNAETSNKNHFLVIVNSVSYNQSLYLTDKFR